MSRRNPYPNYESCEEAWQDLLKETSRPDLSEVRLFAKDKLEYYSRLLEKDTARYAYLESLGGWAEDHYEKSDMGVGFDFDELFDDYDVTDLPIDERLRDLRSMVLFYEELSNVVDYDELEACKLKVPGSSASHYLFKELPPWGMMLDLEEITVPFEFKHYIPKYRVKAIRKEGFFGRATPHRMTLTRLVQDFYIKDNGYIFAYEKGQQDVVVEFGGKLEGTSERALKFLFLPDGEVQYIIPVKCILESKLEEKKGREDDSWVGSDIPLPQKYTLGGVIKCVMCRKDFKLSQAAASSRKSGRLLCADCRS